MRLDVFLVERGYFSSRTRSQAFIMAGKIKVNGLTARKASQDVCVSDQIEVVDKPKYVSRGGEKLEGAFREFGIDPQGRVCLDVGASTGGFTDFLLKNGAKLVYAVDVGWGQLHSSLRSDPRVRVLEKTHILKLDKRLLDPLPSLAVVDVSFISLKKVIQKIGDIMDKGSNVVALIKPQFEVGPRYLKKGVLRSEEVRQNVIRDVIRYAESLGFRMIKSADSSLKGPKGNIKHFVFLQK